MSSFSGKFRHDNKSGIRTVEEWHFHPEGIAEYRFERHLKGVVRHAGKGTWSLAEDGTSLKIHVDVTVAQTASSMGEPYSKDENWTLDPATGTIKELKGFVSV